MDRRGFDCPSSAAAERLESIGRAFLGGYHAVLDDPSVATLGRRIDQTSVPENRGFAYEGAGMALMLLDRLGIGRGSFAAFLEGPGAPHMYLVHVGAGWAVARLPWLRWRLSRTLNSHDSFLRWLVVDGWGFHEGYFHWPATIRRHQLPSGLDGYAGRAFDQGLGRSLWFVEGIDPERVASSISRFPAHRHHDLWAGVGLASAYAGGAGREALERMATLAGAHAAAAAQGAAAAAEARDCAGNPAGYCDLACRVLCGMPADAAAAVARQMRLHLPPDGAIPAYEVWRTRIQQQFVSAEQGVRR